MLSANKRVSPYICANTLSLLLSVGQGLVFGYGVILARYHM
jgi:hypothetical protein